MDKWSPKEFKINLVLAGVVIVASAVCLINSGSEEMVPEYATCLANGGKMLAALGVTWYGLRAARWAVTQ